MYAYESLHRKLTQARKEYCSAVRSEVRRSDQALRQEQPTQVAA